MGPSKFYPLMVTHIISWNKLGYLTRNVIPLRDERDIHGYPLVEVYPSTTTPYDMGIEWS